ncbi:hypothetical protein L484_017041 [Morus notabilis]|uniref:Uncharacterized protein n=1 Tax=Morus notabilis TaxID=981085 RepID=W9RU88_9ROSA|nr:hypothetical protein L484_017041 [Morus notabilis]
MPSPQRERDLSFLSIDVGEARRRFPEVVVSLIVWAEEVLADARSCRHGVVVAGGKQNLNPHLKSLVFSSTQIGVDFDRKCLAGEKEEGWQR